MSHLFSASSCGELACLIPVSRMRTTCSQAQVGHDYITISIRPTAVDSGSYCATRSSRSISQ